MNISEGLAVALPSSSCDDVGTSARRNTRQLPADVYPETLSRLPPLKRETLNEAQQKAYDAVTAPRSGRLNLAGIKGPGGVILRMPKLAKPLGDVNRVLRSELGLDARLVELTILATAREMQSQFEWAMHEPVALEVGVPAATIDMIRHGKPLADVPEKEAALIHLAREAVGAKQVTPATYATALALFGEEELLHYSVLIASYAQGAILLCIVGQELHDHQSPGLPEQEKQ